MPEYITKSRLGRRTISEGRVIVSKAESRSYAGATFLSHSSKDAELLPDVIDLLEKHGAFVYIDKIDKSLPTVTSRETAEALRLRINSSKKFILLATANSKDSRWMPWELGIADAAKTFSNVAIFPTVDSDGYKEWAEQEYLGIYCRIAYGRFHDTTQSIYMVWDRENNSGTELRQWLAS